MILNGEQGKRVFDECCIMFSVLFFLSHPVFVSLAYFCKAGNKYLSSVTLLPQYLNIRALMLGNKVEAQVFSPPCETQETSNDLWYSLNLNFGVLVLTLCFYKDFGILQFLGFQSCHFLKAFLGKP